MSKEEQVNHYVELLKQATALADMPSKFDEFDEFVRLNEEMAQIEQQYSENSDFWEMLEAALEKWIDRTSL